MIATNYGGGFHNSAQAAANFSNQAHNYNTQGNNTPLTQPLMSPQNHPQAAVGGIDIPFMYFTPRDAIKFKKPKNKHNALMIPQQQQQPAQVMH